VLGAQVASEIAQGAASSINSVHADLLPENRSAARRAALALFDSVSVRTGTRVERASAQERERATPAAVASREMHDMVWAGWDSLPRFSETSTDVEDVASGHRELDVLVIGLDSRLGRARGRADALHLITIDLDAPSIRITSIPRGTWSDLGYENDASNIIANVRAARGRKELLRRVARLCHRDSVSYFIEIGFSDAFGILEVLGYADPSAELQALRHRQGYQFGDHNRCYNQGLFIRGAILKFLPLLEGVTGELLVRAGRDFISTNLSTDQCLGVAYLLNDAGLATLPANLTVRLRSRFRESIERSEPGSSYAQSVEGNGNRNTGGTRDAAEIRIRKALGITNTETAPSGILPEKLWTLFRQHAWLQVTDHGTRRQLRDSLAQRLLTVCARSGDEALAREITRTVRADDVLFYQRPQADQTAAALTVMP
jgi:hypothetical protein